MVRRLGVLALVAVVLAAGIVSSAQAALFFLFKPTTAKAGELVTVRLGGTPPGFTLAKREKPFQRPIRLYLVPNDVAGEVWSRFDQRLHFVGALVPDKNSRGILSFAVPPLDTAGYALAYWCRGCARHSSHVGFGVQTVPKVSRYRHVMGLRVQMPDANASCPVTTGRHGNGFLSVSLSEDGVFSMPREADGTLFNKLGWMPKKGFGGNLTVRGERLDGPGRLRVLQVNWGHVYVNGRKGRGSWMSAVKFPSEGCWRLTGRVGDISLSYVVKAVARP